MRFKNTSNILFFCAVQEIPQRIWAALDCLDNLYFNPQYLEALEKNNPQIQFFYIVLLTDKGQPTAFASLQLIDVPMDSLEESLNKNKVFYQFKCLGRKLGVFPKMTPFKVLICGNSFVSGEHGIYIRPEKNKQDAIKEIAKAMLRLVNSDEKLKKDISLFLMKDFIKESLVISDELYELNYYSFNVEPNMVFYIDPNWHSFDDYLKAMKTKFRVKAKRAVQISAGLTLKKESIETIGKKLPQITALYQKVASKAQFNFGEFNIETYVSLLKNLPKNYFLYTYWLDDMMVGFMSGMLNKNSLDAHFVGIDYSKNRALGIYQRMLYDYISMGISHQVERIHFGRTASEIKSSIGAVPQELTCYIRHKKSLTNHFLKPFLKHIEPTVFQQKFPFKTVASKN